MKRRTFMALLGASAIAGARPARAQRARRLPVVGFVLPTQSTSEMSGTDPLTPVPRSVIQGLHDLGWIEGRTVVIERRSAEGQPERAASIFAELLALGVDVLVLGGARWLHDAARAATQSVPIVTLFGDDPVATGLIASLARPGGNMTGVTRTTGPEFHSKRLEMLRELAPNMSRPAFLAQRETLAGFAAVARPKGMTVIPVEVDVPEQFEQAFAKVQREGADGLLAASGPPFLPFAARVAAFALERRLPASFGHRESVDAGGLMMYGPNLPALFRQMTRLVDHILKGAKASDLPTEQPTTFDLILNAKTAKILGLTMPPTLLALADEVIE